MEKDVYTQNVTRLGLIAYENVISPYKPLYFGLVHLHIGDLNLKRIPLSIPVDDDTTLYMYRMHRIKNEKMSSLKYSKFVTRSAFIKKVEVSFDVRKYTDTTFQNTKT